MNRNKAAGLAHKAYGYANALSDEVNRACIPAFSGQSAFFMILSFFPFFMFLSAILRFTPVKESMFLEFIKTVVPASFYDLLSSIISGIYKSQSGAILPLTIATSIWLGSKTFLSLINGLNSVYGIKETRNFVLIRIYSMLYMVVFALLIVAMLTVMVFGNAIYSFICKYFPFFSKTAISIMNIRPLVGFLLMFIFFAIMYKAIPNRKCALTGQMPGAAVAAGGWLVFSRLYSFYVDHFSNYSAFYGAMTVIALLMVWLYACMYILFLGGMINSIGLRKILNAFKSLFS